MSIELIKTASVIFWDFDGVIKDSVSVKSDAFVQLFLPFGKQISKESKIIMKKMVACLGTKSYQYI